MELDSPKKTVQSSALIALLGGVAESGAISNMESIVSPTALSLLELPCSLDTLFDPL
jgi:hypothetical protein